LARRGRSARLRPEIIPNVPVNVNTPQRTTLRGPPAAPAPMSWARRCAAPRESRPADAPAAALFLYGFGYAFATTGCTLPIYGSIIVLPLTSGYGGAALVTFASFAAAMAFMMILTSLLVGLAKASVLRRLQASTVWIKQVSGAMLSRRHVAGRSETIHARNALCGNRGHPAPRVWTVRNDRARGVAGGHHRGQGYGLKLLTGLRGRSPGKAARGEEG
jgi:hypothetical protein